MADSTTVFAAKDESFSATVNRLQQTLGKFSGAVEGFNERAVNMGKSFAGLGVKLAAGVAAFVGVKSAAEGMSRAFSEAGDFQQFERRFETLLGSADEAKARMQELQKFMDGTPFNLPGIVQASQTLQTLTDGALATGDGLRMVGDVASATGKPIDEMATTFGRLYNGLAAGGVSIGDQTKRLVELGVITPQTAEKLKALAEQGVGTAKAFDIVSEMTAKFSGEMQRQSTTWKATLEGLQDAINEALRAFAAPIIDILTPQIQQVADFVRGTLAPAIQDAMAEFTSNWLPRFLEAAETAADYFRGLLNTAPSEMFRIMIANMLDFQRVAADTLLGAFLTAISGLHNGMRALFANDVPQLVGETLGHAFAYSATSLASALFKAMVEVAEYFGTLWQSVTQMSAGELLTKLLDVIQSFATGWARAMVDPIGFISQKIGKGLADAFVDSGHEFAFQFDKATGSWIDKTDRALENTSRAAGQKLGEAGAALGNALLQSMEDAIRETHQIEVNIFGADEAARRMEERFAKMAEYGKSLRDDTEAAATSTSTALDRRNTAGTIDNSSQRIAREQAEARANSAPRGGTRIVREFDPTTDYGNALRERGERSVRFDPATNRLSNTGLAVERINERFSVDRTASDIRSDLARLNNRMRPALDRAERFEQQGMFGSAERLRGRIDRRMAEAEKRLADKYGLDVQDQIKTPEERQQEEEEMRAKHAPKGGNVDQGIIDQIYSLLKEHMPSIDEKLPQHALVPD